MLQGMCVGVELLRQCAHQAPVSGFLTVSVSIHLELNEVLSWPFSDHFPRDSLGVPQVEVAETSNAEESHRLMQHVLPVFFGLEVGTHLLRVLVGDGHADPDLPLGCRGLDAGSPDMHPVDGLVTVLRFHCVSNTIGNGQIGEGKLRKDVEVWRQRRQMEFAVFMFFDLTQTL